MFWEFVNVGLVVEEKDTQNLTRFWSDEEHLIRIYHILKQKSFYSIVLWPVSCVPLFSLTGVQWVMLRRVVEVLCGWRNWSGKCSGSIWNMIPICLTWVIWREIVRAPNWLTEIIDCKVVWVGLNTWQHICMFCCTVYCFSFLS